MAISAIAGLAAAGGAFAAATIAGTAFTLAAFATTFAIGAGLSIVSRALMPKPDLGGLMQGVTGTVREATASRKVIYGKVRVGGAVVFIANSNQNKDLYLVICFACHEIEGYEAVYFNDEKVWENGSFVSDWGSYASFGFYDGTQTTADSVLSNASAFWGSTHVLNGIAYMRVKLTWDEDRKKFPQGVPNVSAVIKGKKLYDPRLDSTIGGSGGHRSGDPSTWAWSQNPALALYDYMTNTYYGLGESHLSMDYTSFGDAADTCDEAVALDAGGTHDRYHADGVLDTGNAIKGNIEALTAAMGGRVGYVDGKYFAQAAEYHTPTITIDESMMVGAMSVQTKQSRRSMYNGVKGVFLSEEQNYTLVDYPAKISSAYSADDGDPIYLDMPLPFVTNNIRAQRLAKIALLKSRQQVVVNVPLNLTALKFKAGDFIAITSDRMDWTAKPFEVIGYDLQIGSDGAIIVNVQAIETDSAVYDWTASADEDPFNEPNDPTVNDGATVEPPTNLQLEETTSLAADGTVVPALKISWTASVDGFVEYYEVEVMELVGGVEQEDTNIFNTTTKTSILITGLKTDSTLYRVKVRAVNTIGVKSTDLTNATAFNLGGDTTAPGVPTNLTANGGYKQITVSWVNPTDSDLKHVEIQVWNGSAWEDLAVVSGEVFVHFVNSFGTTKYYRVRAVDFSGNASAYTNYVQAETEFVDNSAFEDGIVDFFESQGAYAIENGSSLPSGYTSGDAGKLFFLTTNGKLYRWTGSAWTAAIVDLPDLSGQITTTQIADDAITTPKITAGAITASEIAGTTITGDKIVANTITGGLLATSGVITQTAQINDGLITNAKIANLAVDTAKIVNAAVETLKIDGEAVTIPDGDDASVSVNVANSFVFVDAGYLYLSTWTANDTPSALIIGGHVQYVGEDIYGTKSRPATAYIKFVWDWRTNTGTYTAGSGFNSTIGVQSLAQDYGGSAVSITKIDVPTWSRGMRIRIQGRNEAFAGSGSASREVTGYGYSVLASKR